MHPQKVFLGESQPAHASPAVTQRSRSNHSLSVTLKPRWSIIVFAWTEVTASQPTHQILPKQHHPWLLKGLTKMKNALLTLAAILALSATSAAQPVQAAEPIGQMIDDSGLVISSYTDGSVKEFQVPGSIIATLKILSTSSQRTATILDTAAKSTVSEL